VRRSLLLAVSYEPLMPMCIYLVLWKTLPLHVKLDLIIIFCKCLGQLLIITEKKIFDEGKQLLVNCFIKAFEFMANIHFRWMQPI
jgi:hypothetical protein